MHNKHVLCMHIVDCGMKELKAQCIHAISQFAYTDSTNSCNFSSCTAVARVYEGLAMIVYFVLNCEVSFHRTHGAELASCRAAVESEILMTTPSVSWGDIAGMTGVKRVLQEAVVLPSMRPDIFTGLRAPTRGLFLFSWRLSCHLQGDACCPAANYYRSNFMTHVRALYDGT